MSESTNRTDTGSTDPEPAICHVDDTDQTDQPDPQHTAPDGAAGTNESVDTDEATSSPDGPNDGTEHPIDAVPDKTPQTFEAAIEASRLTQLLKTVTTVVEECRFHLGEDALYIRAVDPANAAMADIAVSLDAFETYESSGGMIGVDLTRLTDVIGLATNDDLVQLELDPRTRKISIMIDTMEYTLALINPDSIRLEPDIPDLELPATVGLPAGELARAIKAAGMVADHITLGVDPVAECFRTEASGDTDDVTLEIPHDDCDTFDRSTDPVTALYSLEYLKALCQPLPADAPITLTLGDDFPLEITFTAVEETIDGHFLLAPRLQTE